MHIGDIAVMNNPVDSVGDYTNRNSGCYAIHIVKHIDRVHNADNPK